MKISIIGSGNIGTALITGLIKNNTFDRQKISLSDISQKTLEPFALKGIHTTIDNKEVVADAGVVILCVKPYLVGEVIEEILPCIKNDALIVSLAAGITLNQLTLFAGERPLYRVVPNTAMAVNQSMTAVAANFTSPEQDKIVEDLFSSVGKVMMTDESLLNAVTVIASCGTAFALRYLRAAMTAGIETGMRPDVARLMVAQTMLGAALLSQETGKHPEQEIDKVTTPKGITIKGLNEMEHAGFSSSVIKGIMSAFNSLEL